jgi:hypothetical protein
MAERAWGRGGRARVEAGDVALEVVMVPVSGVVCAACFLGDQANSRVQQKA